MRPTHTQQAHPHKHRHSSTFPGAGPGLLCSIILSIVFNEPLVLPSTPKTIVPSLFLLLIAHWSVIFGGPLHGLPPCISWTLPVYLSVMFSTLSSVCASSLPVPEVFLTCPFLQFDSFQLSLAHSDILILNRIKVPKMDLNTMISLLLCQLQPRPSFA